VTVPYLVEFNGSFPDTASDAYLAPTATLIGRVTLHAASSVWFGAVLRGDFGRIVVGEGSCVQDNAVLHAAEEFETNLGQNVTVGHGALCEGCVVADGALVGMGAVVLQGARIGEGSVVAAGSVVKEGTVIPGGVLCAGAPAEVKKTLSGSSAQWAEAAAREYRELRLAYLKQARVA
jgi:carbonic anhydrase/acetyltransferase-like protein (isoleucine patch superfamily)